MSDPRTGPRHEPERIHERAADSAEAADRPLEPKAPHRELSERDEPGAAGTEPAGPDPHHVLNRPADRTDPTADSDPYGEPTEEEEQDRASGVRGSGQGAEQ